jgi:hypothetical protein
MRKIFVVVFGLVFIQSNTSGQVGFQTFLNYNSVSSRSNEFATDFIELADSSVCVPFFCANLNQVDTLGYAKTYVAYSFFSKEGRVMDTFRYSKNGNSVHVRCIESFNDPNNYLMVGYNTELVKLVNDTIGANLLLIKVNQQGDTIWTKTISFSDGDELPSKLIKTNDGGFAIVGQSCDKLETNCDMFLLKLDSNANEQWHKTYAWDDNSWELPAALIEVSTGGFLMSAAMYSIANNDTLKPLLICTDQAGTVKWKINTPNEGKTYAYFDDVQQTENNVILLCGTIGDDKLWEDETFGWLASIDTNGLITKSKKIGVPNRETAFQNLSVVGKKYYIQGFSDAYNVDRRNTNFLYSLNEDLSINWLRTYQDSLSLNQTYVIYNLKRTSDGGFAMVGFGDDPKRAGNNQDVWFLKVDSNGCLYQPCLSVGMDKGSEIVNQEVLIYPQPAQDQFQIKTDFEYERVELLQMNGQVICDWRFSQVYHLPSVSVGIYLIRLTNKGGRTLIRQLTIEN